MESGLQEGVNFQNTYRADFDQSEFERLIQEKGRRVLFSKALNCPCKSKSTNHLSTCRNCGGSGWIFVNPVTTRMIVTGVSITSDYKAWSEESRGMINISAPESTELSTMDKVTLLDAEAIYSEVLFLNSDSNKDFYFASSAYDIKEISYCGLFLGDSQSLLQVPKKKIQKRDNWIAIKKDFIEEQNISTTDISITIRYIHPPSYHVVELKRETMQSFRLMGTGEVNQNMPISAIARRAHYILNPTNLNGEGLLDNSYKEDKDCGCACAPTDDPNEQFPTEHKKIFDQTHERTIE